MRGLSGTIQANEKWQECRWNGEKKENRAYFSGAGVADKAEKGGLKVQLVQMQRIIIQLDATLETRIFLISDISCSEVSLIIS